MLHVGVSFDGNNHSVEKSIVLVSFYNIWRLFTVALRIHISSLATANRGLVPKIRNVGLIPVTWQGLQYNLSPLARAKSLIESGYIPPHPRKANGSISQ